MDAVTMPNASERLRRTLTWCEAHALRAVLGELGQADEGVVRTSHVARGVAVSKTNVTTAMRLAEAAGVLVSRSLGMRGTWVRITDRGALEEALRNG